MGNSDDQIERDLCPYFGECGGCQIQDVDYSVQLKDKEGVLKVLFADYWDGDIPVHPSPIQYHYRNKIDMNFARKQYDEKPADDFIRETLLGFNKKGKWYFPLDIEECRIGPESATTLTRAVRCWIQEHDYRAVDRRSEDGILRILLHREGKRTGEGMVVLITSDGELDTDSFVETVLSAFPAVSIYRGIHRRTARGAFADELELLYGEEHIREELHIPDGDTMRKLRFRISPFSFFQTNTLGAEVLYGMIREWVKEISPSILYDLYGGAGAIAFACSDLVDLVRSVEVVESATLDGEYNAKANGIENVFFTTDKIRGYLQNVLDQGGMERNSAVVVDPPREGMTPKPLRRLIQSKPSDILYVSCKPSVFAEEMKEFSKHYILRSLRAVDLFPHTEHVELVAALKRK
ncbi:MAG: 23S rRNA (uracil(1939)-C(5))-methyltransferase RlmD [Candidatus Hydrogenedentota bacterium]